MKEEKSRLEETRKTIINPEHWHVWENSDLKRNIIAFFDNYLSQNPPKNPRRYALLRDFIFVEISIQNGPRPGVLHNLTLEEFTHSHEEQADNINFIVMQARNHKTVANFGDARIYLKKEIFNYLKFLCKIFVHQCTVHTIYYRKWEANEIWTSKYPNEVDLEERWCGFEKSKALWESFLYYYPHSKLINMPEVYPWGPQRCCTPSLSWTIKTQERYYNIKKFNKSAANGALLFGQLMHREIQRQTALESQAITNINSTTDQ